jgi:SPP1 family predicted phage head-tail adaptor
MRAGKLNKRVWIQRPPEAGTQNAYGEKTEVWKDWKQAWVGIEPVAGSEQVVANTTEARITHAVTLRFTADLVPKMRFRYGTRVLAMVTPLDIGERGKEMTVQCVEVLP